MSEEHAPAPPVTSTTPVISDPVWESVSSNWIASIRSTPISQNTEGWNALMGALPRLRTALESALKV